MKKDSIRKYRQAALELRKYLRTGRYKTFVPNRAFIEWYIHARFGQPDSKRLLDGKKDGGLDAIVENDGTTFVLQSKYEDTAKVSLVRRDEIAAFEAIARKFKDPDSAEEFTRWRDNR